MASALEQRYAMLSQQVRSREQAQQQQEQEALKRKFASIGALGSGASIKAQQKVSDIGARREAESMGQLDIARLAEEQQLQESEKQREFARQERLGGQEFSGLQAELNRKFSTQERLGGQEFARGERLGGQEFGASQADLARQFATQERLGGEKFGERMQTLQQKFARTEREAGQEYATREAEKGRTFAGQQAKEERIARSADISKQLASSEAQAQAARTLQQEMFNREFDINKIVTAYNLGWRPTAEQTRQLPQILGYSSNPQYGSLYGSYGPGIQGSADWSSLPMTPIF